MKVRFAVPGSKTYINRYYKNDPRSFINISLTGKRCSLMCVNCRAVLLKSMVDASSENIVDIVSRNHCKELNGILISGGFTKDGRLALSGSHLGQLKILRKKYPGLKILIHCGFTDSDMAKKIASISPDGVLLNIVADTRTIEAVYGLKGFSPRDYYLSFEHLKGEGLDVAPHIVTGLLSPVISSEYRAVDTLIDMGAGSLVFVVNKRLSKAFKDPGYDRNGFVGLVKYAREKSKDIKISFGCAQPSGRDKTDTEIELLRLKIDSMAFPSEKAIEFALKNDIAFKFSEECCAFL